MNEQSSKKSSLFLMELIIALLFFSFCAAVCVNIFAKARLISLQSYELNKSVIAAQNAAECYSAADSDQSLLAQILGGTINDNTIKIAYNKDWEISDANSAVYVLTIAEDESEGSICSAHITVCKDSDIIYSLTAVRLAGNTK